MKITKITQKGQTTIPSEIRHFMGLSAGSELVYVPLPDGTVLLKTKKNNLSGLKGFIKTNRTISLEEMEQAIQRNRVKRFLKA